MRCIRICAVFVTFYKNATRRSIFGCRAGNDSLTDGQDGVLGIVYRAISTPLIREAGYTGKTADTGAATLIQRFGNALNLNIHCHMLLLDGVYVDGTNGASSRFHWVNFDYEIFDVCGGSMKVIAASKTPR